MTTIAESDVSPKLIDGSRATWQDMEDAFRVHAFNVLYKRTYRHEPDLLRRFVKALLESNRPIKDRQAVIDWYRSLPGYRQK